AFSDHRQHAGFATVEWRAKRQYQAGHLCPPDCGRQIMKLGAERKKVAFLVVLTGAAAYLLYSNVFSSAPGSGSSGSPRPTAARPGNATKDARPQAAAPVPTTPPASGRAAASRRTSQEFRPPW